MRELVRQSIHFGGTMLVIVGVHGAGVSIVQTVLGVLLVLAALASLVFFFGYSVPWVQRVVDFARRQSEHAFPLIAPILWAIGVLFALLLFSDPWVLTVGLIPLAVGDSISTLVGKKFGRTKLVLNKTLEGTTAFFVSTFVVLALVLPVGSALAIALASAGIEIVPVNDNLTLPVAGVFLASLFV